MQSSTKIIAGGVVSVGVISRPILEVIFKLKLPIDSQQTGLCSELRGGR